ncbi:MAG: hypothetical protein NUW00_03325 [Candidatus Kaiserbacteria bacterium]|nr:hypothetical protein [Candidatus Kaiserbacteria bacterium]
MIITANSPDVLALKYVWDSAEKRTEGLGNGLQRRLTRSVLAPAIQGHVGELILKYQEFLTTVPNGFHSFAHGSGMRSETVRWVSVARLTGDTIEEIREEHHPLHAQGSKFTFITPSKVLAPVLWENNLKPRYRRGVNRPHFVFGKMAEQNEGKFDISLLGNHLFRYRRGDLDWATKIEIAVGDESVGAWLRERKSALAYNMFTRR